MAIEPTADTRTRAQLRAYRVLLVEDNPAEAELVFERLSASGPGDFDITHVLNMERAISACERDRYDCIVLDLQLPDTRGVETIKAMRARSPDAAIVAYSGMDDEFARASSLREGAQDFISKNGPEARSLDRGILFALERWRALKLHQQLEDVFAANPDAMIVHDSSGVVRFVNPAAKELFDRTDALIKVYPELIDDGRPFSEFILERRGQTRICEVRVADCIWDGETCWLAVVRDVTEQKALVDRLLKFNKIELIGRFAGGLAHDFGNVLGCIDMVADAALRDAAGDGAVSLHLKKIMGAAESGRAIVRKLLSLEISQISAPERVDLIEVLGETEKLLRQILPEEISVRVATPHALPFVLINRSHLEQILLNLALNARDAMPGGGAMTIMCEACAPPSTMVNMSISDTGVGIAAKDQPHIFELFFTTKHKGEGSGIGLAICHAMIEQAGGEISLRSQLGQGTTFSLLLPTSARSSAMNRGAALN